MRIVTKVQDMQSISQVIRSTGKKIALVPTMGSFHQGHLSLMKHAREYADNLVASLFVNPTQFGPNEDFERYPRDFDRDRKMANDVGVDFLFYPSISEMYPEGYKTEVTAPEIGAKFEGSKRSGHFDGVATVVTKLFNAIQPQFAVFGQKDYQQTLVIRHIASSLLFNIKIITSPTVRESSGLAMSSRNVFLEGKEREDAAILFHTLGKAIDSIHEGEKNRKQINALMHNSLRDVQNIQIDYASAADAYNLTEPDDFLPGQQVVLMIAAYIGKTRLIDNAVVNIPKIDSKDPNAFLDLTGRKI